MPDRIVLTRTGDPATSQAVTWRTDASVTEAVAEITEASHGPGFVEGRRSLDAQTTALQTNLGQVNYHTVEFVDLQPGTKYAYRVGDGKNWSAWMHFTTARQDHSPFSFIYFGDAQNNFKSMWSRVIREAYSDAPKAAFIIALNSNEQREEQAAWLEEVLRQYTQLYQIIHIDGDTLWYDSFELRKRIEYREESR